MSSHHKHVTLTQPAPGKTAAATKAAVAPGAKQYKTPLASAEEIRLCAYQKWENAGKPAGDGIQFWLEAEQELAQGK